MNSLIRPATPNDASTVLAMLPRLADFEVPKNRNPDDLWQGDAKMFNQWVDGTRDDIDVLVAEKDSAVIGASIVSYRKELLSGEPSAHLEVLVLDKAAQGQGIASELMRQTEQMVLAKGAKWMSLHVFANNERARALYERQGFEGELLRYLKLLGGC